MIDYRLTTFIMVAKTKNFTKAAKILNLTHPAVSQHIKALEAFYQIKLFNQVGKEMILTDEGALLLEYTKEMNRLSALASKNLRNISSKVQQYHIGATLSIGGYVLPKILGDYRQDHDDIELVLYVENTETILNKLSNGEIDLGIIEGPFDQTKYKYRNFKDDELVFVTAQTHPFVNRETISFSEAIQEKLILRERGSGTRKIFENKVRELGYTIEELNIYMEIGDILALLSLVESDLGCTIISKEVTRFFEKFLKIKSIPLDNLRIERSFNFVYLESPQQDFVIDFINYCLGYQ
jgi:DNA-binding transcriptional LysR family regulator